MSKLVPDKPDYGTEITHNTSVTHLRFTAAPVATTRAAAAPAATNNATNNNDCKNSRAQVPPLQKPRVMMFNDTSHLTRDMLSV